MAFLLVGMVGCGVDASDAEFRQASTGPFGDIPAINEFPRLSNSSLDREAGADPFTAGCVVEFDDRACQDFDRNDPDRCGVTDPRTLLETSSDATCTTDVHGLDLVDCDEECVAAGHRAGACVDETIKCGRKDEDGGVVYDKDTEAGECSCFVGPPPAYNGDRGPGPGSEPGSTQQYYRDHELIPDPFVAGCISVYDDEACGDFDRHILDECSDADPRLLIEYMSDEFPLRDEACVEATLQQTFNCDALCVDKGHRAGACGHAQSHCADPDDEPFAAKCYCYDDDDDDDDDDNDDDACETTSTGGTYGGTSTSGTGGTYGTTGTGGTTTTGGTGGTHGTTSGGATGGA